MIVRLMNRVARALQGAEATRAERQRMQAALHGLHQESELSWSGRKLLLELEQRASQNVARS